MSLLARVKTKRTEINHIHQSSLLTVQLDEEIAKIVENRDGEQEAGKINLISKPKKEIKRMR